MEKIVRFLKTLLTIIGIAFAVLLAVLIALVFLTIILEGYLVAIAELLGVLEKYGYYRN